jgi:hypothetical protein
MNWKRRRIKRTRGKDIYKSVWSFKGSFRRDYALCEEFKEEIKRKGFNIGG